MKRKKTTILFKCYYLYLSIISLVRQHHTDISGYIFVFLIFVHLAMYMTSFLCIIFHIQNLSLLNYRFKNLIVYCVTTLMCFFQFSAFLYSCITETRPQITFAIWIAKSFKLNISTLNNFEVLSPIYALFMINNKVFLL